jgi:hypothetical protein
MADTSHIPDITPETRIGPLLEAYPALEDVLLGMSPHFAKLKNPVLRNTVAKIATLRQVAEIGGVPLAALINDLRAAAGIADAYADSGTVPADDDTPSWVRSRTVASTYDARADLAAGQHPAQRVMADLQKLASEEAYVLVTPFTPAPLIDLARSKGFSAWSMKEDEQTVKTFFTP